jgi:hypothetical protein
MLYRGAGLDVVWAQFLAVAVIGGLFFGLAIIRFRSVAAQTTCTISAQHHDAKSCMRVSVGASPMNRWLDHPAAMLGPLTLALACRTAAVRRIS